MQKAKAVPTNEQRHVSIRFQKMREALETLKVKIESFQQSTGNVASINNVTLRVTSDNQGFMDAAAHASVRVHFTGVSYPEAAVNT